MDWDTPARAFLDAGNAPNFLCCAVFDAVEFATGTQRYVGFWDGLRNTTRTLDGRAVALTRCGEALQFSDWEYGIGTEIRSYEFGFAGLNEEGQGLLRTWNVLNRPVQTYQLLYSMGGVFQGARRMFDGFVDELDDTDDGSGGANLIITAFSTARRGTKSRGSKKGHASFSRRGGDTSMEYASLPNAVGDQVHSA